MAKPELTTAEEALLDPVISSFNSQRNLVGQFLENVNIMFTGSDRLMSLAHSVKRRVKNPDHLRDKLTRRLLGLKAKGQDFDVTPDNLFSKITDLAGFRILHLHTQQMKQIHETVLALLDEARYPLVGDPEARIWDEESRSYFEGIGIKTVVSPKMYSSVHYVIEGSSKTKITCEIQVRTLAEEVWGEVDHSFNYPHPTGSISCREQIRVLARVASSCSRLVDSIFKSYEDYCTREEFDSQTEGSAAPANRDAQRPRPVD